MAGGNAAKGRLKQEDVWKCNVDHNVLNPVMVKSIQLIQLPFFNLHFLCPLLHLVMIRFASK